MPLKPAVVLGKKKRRQQFDNDDGGKKQRRQFDDDDGDDDDDDDDDADDDDDDDDGDDDDDAADDDGDDDAADDGVTADLGKRQRRHQVEENDEPGFAAALVPLQMNPKPQPLRLSGGHASRILRPTRSAKPSMSAEACDQVDTYHQRAVPPEISGDDGVAVDLGKNQRRQQFEENDDDDEDDDDDDVDDDAADDDGDDGDDVMIGVTADFGKMQRRHQVEEKDEPGFAAALVPLQRSMSGNFPPSHALNAWVLIHGRNGVVKNPKEAFNTAEEGARQGCHDCQGVMAFCLLLPRLFRLKEQGDVNPRFLELARLSSASGSRFGQYTLGRWHEIGKPDDGQKVPHFRREAVQLHKLAAAQGLDDAQFQLGKMSIEGRCGLDTNHAEGLRWWQLAAAQGHPEAMHNVANCHRHGYIVTVDLAEAIRWYRRAEAAGWLLAAGYLRRCMRKQQVEHEDGLPESLSLMAVAKMFFGMLVEMQLCNPQGTCFFSFVHLPPPVPRAFAGAPLYDMSLKQVERLCLVGCGFKGRLVRLLSLGMGLHFEPQKISRACHKMMHSTALRVASKLPGVFRDKVAKEAEALCAAGQCAAALVPLQRAIYFGDLPSRALNAWVLIDGRVGVTKNQKKAFELVDEGARLGCHHCQGVMAHCNVFGHGCKQNHARSLELARLSSDSGSRYGQYTLGWLHQFGKAGLSVDRAQAVTLYQLAASQGLDKAQRALGQTRTFHTLVIDRDEGRRCLQLAFAQDDRLETDSERDSDWDDPYEGDGPYPNYLYGASPPPGWVAPPGFRV